MSAAREILRAAQPPWRRFAVGVLWGLLSAIAAVALLATSGWLIVTASIVDTLVALSLAVVGVRLFATSRAVFRYLERIAGHDAALRQLASMRANVVRRLIPLSPAGITRTDRGSVLAALVDDVDELQNLPLRVVQPVLVGGVVALGAVTVAIVISPAAGLALLACVLIAAAAAVFWGWLAGAKAERAIAPARADLTSALTDYVGSLDVLEAYGAEPQARARITASDAALRRALTRAAGAQGASGTVLSAMSGVASLAAVGFAAPAVFDRALAAPWLAVVALLPMIVFEVFGTIPLAASAWRTVHSSAERVAAVVPSVVPTALVQDDVAATGEAVPVGSGITLRGVTAGWPDAPPVLHDLSLDVGPAERVLVIGSSGSGKSTLAHVLVRFLESAGTYTLGGQDVHAVSGDDVRRTIGLCEQDPMIFDEDIRQNLLFAREDATDADLEAVLARVGLAPWLTDRGGLDARVGERGALVSGGQAQRIALARALLRDFPVLVLDEPTAGVDPDASDALLRDLLTATGDDRAVILISHVSVPDGLVDRTLRLSDGRLSPV